MADREYVWRTTEPARSFGHCEFCKQVIPAGRTLAILHYGSRANEWVRSHVDCAWNVPNVVNKPPIQPVDIPAEIPTKGISPLSGETVHAPRFPRLGLCTRDLPGRAAKHELVVDDQVVWASKNRDHVEGVIEFLQHNPKLAESLG